MDLSPVPTVMAETGCHPTAGLHLIGPGSELPHWGRGQGGRKGQQQRLLGHPRAPWGMAGEGRPARRRKFRQHHSLGPWPLLGHKQELLAEQKLG